ncbi:DedA family protein, partial [Patescibacteria group bacterium]|nr:DedA family protein [Patescibacteria group bacterium]
MESLLHINLSEFVHAIGYIGIFFIVFAECGLFFGFLFPGDSLLFTAGFLASQKFLDINILVMLVIIATIS